MDPNAKFLDERLTLLEKARPWSPRVMAKFELFLQSPDEHALFRANPYRFASERGVEPAEAVDLFLHASKTGILRMEWHVICPNCGDSIESFGALEHVHSHYFCRLCQEACEANLDDYIQVSFTVSPQARSITYHHPEDLSPEDFFFKYHFSPFGRFPGGPLFVEVMRSISLGAFYLEPGGTSTLEAVANPGALFGFDMIHNQGFMIPLQGPPSAAPQRAVVEMTDEGHKPSVTILAPGPLSLTFVNKGTSRASLMLNVMPPDKPSGALVFDPFLTGKSLFNNQTFRNLYPSATLGEKGGIGVKDLTLLFTDLKGSTALYDRIGDLKAFTLVQQHFERLTRAIQANQGAVVKTIGDAVMASFDKPDAAVRAAVGMLKEIEEFNQEHGEKEIILKIGIHRGTSIAVTLNDRLDYFGQTVNIAARVQGLAGAEEIYMTKTVYLSPGVKELLGEFHVTPESASLKGIQKAMQVYRVTYGKPDTPKKRDKAGKPKPKGRKKKISRRTKPKRRRAAARR